MKFDRHHRSAAALLMGLVLPFTAACGETSTPTAPDSGTQHEKLDLDDVKADPALHGLLPDQIRSAGVLTVATNAASPPIEFFSDDAKTIVGLDPDLGAALGRRLGVEFRFINVSSFSGIIPGLTSGRFDVAMSSITDRVDRQKQVDFVDYANVGMGILLPQSNSAQITGLGDLCGLSAAVQTGTQGQAIAVRESEKCRSDGKPDLDIQTFPAQAEAQLQIRSGRADININDYPIVAHTAEQSNGQLRAATVQFDTAPYGIAVPKGNPQLLQALKAALDSLIADGTYGKVLDHWDLSMIAILAATINGPKA